MTADQNEAAAIEAVLRGQRTKLAVDFRPNTVTLGLDYFSRLFISLLFLVNKIGFGLFIGLHIGLFMLEMFVAQSIEDNLKKKIVKELEPGYNQHVREYVPVITLPLNWLGIYMVTGLLATIVIITKNFSDAATSWIQFIILVALTLVGAFLSMVAAYMSGSILFDRKIKGYHFMLPDFPGTKTTYTDVTATFPRAFRSLEEEPAVAIDTLDENDGLIARLESDLKGINSKVDSYLLESVLLGALAFSGFLTIVASNVISGGDGQFTAIISRFMDTIRTLLFSENAINAEDFSNLFKGTNLFIVIMFESLICSVFFIMVLTLRLRYSDMSLKMDYLIRIITIFNAKEEELIVLKMEEQNQDNARITERTQLLTKKIAAGISDANHLLSQLTPVLGMMSFYRNLGLAFFYLVLVTSGLYFTPLLSLFIIVVAISSKLYRVIGVEARLEKMQRILRKH